VRDSATVGLDGSVRQSLLEVVGLTTQILTPAGARTVVHELSFTVHPNEVLALIGESGSGKSLTAQSITGLLPSPPARVVSGTAHFEGRDLLAMSKRELRLLRGDRIGMIFQEPLAALNPMMPVGDQIAETLVTHRGLTWQAARAETLRLLDRVRIHDPKSRAKLYPASLSGGMCQRIVIAAALACKPSLVIADEPTTALDATVQAEILSLLKELQAEVGCGVIFITHDMGIVRQVADRIVVMQNGRSVETGTTSDIFATPKCAYTRVLIDATSPATPKPATASVVSPLPSPLLIENLSLSFPRAPAMTSFTTPDRLFALDGISLTMNEGQTLALVGESGSGKTTLARAILGLTRTDNGRILVGGLDVEADRDCLRGRVQYVFQDPQSSLDPRWRAWQSVIEPLRLSGEHNTQILRANAAKLMRQVGLADFLDRFPHELSGGQRQRLGIARALSAAPQLIIADEPVSALDPSTRLQVLDLFEQIQQDTHVPMLFITHDFAVVTRVAHRVAVMRFGRVVELGPTAAVLGNPQHAYTRALINAAISGSVHELPHTSGHRIGPKGSTRPWNAASKVSDGHFVEIAET
jgi:peptide/nickel transport system ATP-binding protein